MKTFKRICFRDFEFTDSQGAMLELKRGHEYITSAESDGLVTVFTKYWVKVPVDLFGGEISFTG